MFQADKSHTTTPPSAPAGAAVSTPIKTPTHGLNRSQVMKRAWQLAALNNPIRKNKRHEQLGRWMRHAWDEARRGHTDNWTFLSPEHEARCLEHQLVTLQYDDRRTEAHYARVIDGRTGKPRSRVNVEAAAKHGVGSNLDRYDWKPCEIGKDSPLAGETEPLGIQGRKAA